MKHAHFSSLVQPLFTRPMLLAVSLMLALACSPAIVQAQSRPGTPPVLVVDGTAQLTAPMSANQMLRIVIGIKPPRMDEEEQLLRDLHDKSSPLFHQFLTQKQWNDRFAPSAEDEQAVVDWLQGQGLHVTNRYANRLVVDAEGSVAALEKAFNIKMNLYQLAGATVFSNDRDPTLPANLVGIVQSLQGLDNIRVLHPVGRTIHEPAMPIYAPGAVFAKGPSGGANGDRAKLNSALASGKNLIPSITNGFYDPTDIYSSTAYDTNALYNQGHCCNPFNNSGGTPPTTSIAISSVGQQAPSDFAGFHTQYPYLAYHYFLIFVDGTPSCCDLEGTMDFEWSTAMSNSFGAFQNTSSVFMYDGVNALLSTFTDIYNKVNSDGNARVFSTSWGCAEFYCADSGTMDTDHAIFNSMVGTGWTLVAASDDKGSTADCSHVSVEFPASDPNFVAAGGTTLFTGASFSSESGWTGGTFAGACASNDGGSGGGCSAKYAAPSYQGSPACGAGSRSVPDIALNASVGQNIFFNGSLTASGGTSIVAPELAGFFAQTNAYFLTFGNICGVGVGTEACAPMGNANFYLYKGTSAPHNPYYDITSGCNSNDITAANSLTFYCAGSGYDLVTGWGSANMLQLAWAIAWNNAADDGRPVVSYSGPITNKWYNTNQQVSWTVADTGGGFSPTGVAGFSQAWDADPGDPTTEPHPGSGNSFYSGPQFPNSTTGCLQFTSGGPCAGGVAQGCHNAHVRAWDNMGFGSGDVVYGPICYDIVMPHTAGSLSGTQSGSGSLYVTPVVVTLTASDNLSGVASTVYQLDGGAVTLYSAPFTVLPQGNHTVTFHSSDVAGNIESTETIKFGIARWVTMKSGTTVSLRAISCSAASTCEAVGASGAIRGTTSYGNTWTGQTSGTANTLNGVSCVGAFCVAVGNSGTIRVTTNGGTTWVSKPSGTTNNLRGVSCVTSSFCVAVGNSGTIRVTTNGGSTWPGKVSGTANTLNGVSCPTTSFCIVVGASGTIRATTNGGTTWAGKTSGTTSTLNGVSCPSTTVCKVVGGSGAIRTTSNGGTSWTAQVSGTTLTLNAVSCPSTSTCTVVGASGKIVATTNGGTNWGSQPSSTSNTLWGTKVQSAGNGYAVGDLGIILRR